MSVGSNGDKQNEDHRSLSDSSDSEMNAPLKPLNKRERLNSSSETDILLAELKSKKLGYDKINELPVVWV